MINKTKTKILTLSVASIVGLAAITVLASNATNNVLDFQGEVKQNAHLELNELKLIENPTKPGVTSQTDVTWKMDDNELVATKEAKGTTNTVKGQWTLSIWGQSNSITESESFILWGTKNALGAKTSIIGASNRVKITEWEENVVLSSSNWTVKGTGNIILSSNPYPLNRVNGSWNIALSVEWSRIKSNGSMAIGKNIQIENEWTFVFNAKPGGSAPFKSKNDYTTLIFANNGMIINTNKRNTQNVGVTVNWGIKVGQTPNLDKPWSLITQDNCLQLKSTEKGAISLKCRGVETDRDQILQTPKCWRNAANYHYTDSRWKGAENSDFCAQGTFEGDKSFRSEEQRKTPKGIWSYADRGFTYDFTICFRDKDPLCASKNLSKTWRCKTQEGNAVVCKANLRIKPMQCGANQHLEDEGQTNGTTAQGRKCLPNQKNVPCDDKGINKANGSFTNENVSVTRDANNRTYTTPSKCTLKCNEGFKLNEAKTACMSSTKQVSCDKTWTLPSNATWKDATVTATRNSQKNSWDTPKCDFECKTGYYYDNNDGEPKCLKIPFSCEPWDNVTNATLVSTQEGIVGRDNKRNTLIWNWENPTTTCQYKCKTGYNLVVENWVKSCKKPENGVCISRKYQCLRGSVTEGTQKQTDTHYTWECKWRYWGTPKQCTLSKSPQCTGNIPANASISQEQKTWFNGNKTITLVKTINPNQKCQAVCNPEFELKNSNCVKKEAQCKVWQYKDGNMCKDKTLKITLKNNKISAPFPQEVCTLSDENFIHLNVWAQEKKLSACTIWSFIFTGDISWYDFQWKVKTDKISTRRITFWMNWGPYEDATSVDEYGLRIGLNLQGGQSWTDFTTGEVVIENTNIPVGKTKYSGKDERFNETEIKRGERKRDIETLESLRKKYKVIPNDISKIECRFVMNENAGFDVTKDKVELKEQLPYYHNSINTISLVAPLNSQNCGIHFDKFDKNQRSSNLMLWIGSNKGEKCSKWPVTCHPTIGYIGPQFKDKEWNDASLFDVQIRLYDMEWEVVKYDKK